VHMLLILRKITCGRTFSLRVIGVGIDIVDLDVFRARLDDGLIEELFLPEEVKYCSGRARPWESYAARFAAKEATFKALSAGLSQGLRWKHVEILKDESGAVAVQLTGLALKQAQEKKVKEIHLSVSHTKLNAMAIVVMEG
ncbi:MAG: holo-ACP synthase, partial [Candidatus Fermentibacteraceae bacterium]|nr:holo-ACP synthase [Candidatus Fermentibacteraceae bacterium]